MKISFFYMLALSATFSGNVMANHSDQGTIAKKSLLKSKYPLPVICYRRSSELLLNILRDPNDSTGRTVRFEFKKYSRKTQNWEVKDSTTGEYIVRDKSENPDIFQEYRTAGGGEFIFRGVASAPRGKDYVVRHGRGSYTIPSGSMTFDECIRGESVVSGDDLIQSLEEAIPPRAVLEYPDQRCSVSLVTHATNSILQHRNFSEKYLSPQGRRWKNAPVNVDSQWIKKENSYYGFNGENGAISEIVLENYATGKRRVEVDGSSCEYRISNRTTSVPVEQKYFMTCETMNKSGPFFGQIFKTRSDRTAVDQFDVSGGSPVLIESIPLQYSEDFIGGNNVDTYINHTDTTFFRGDELRQFLMSIYFPQPDRSRRWLVKGQFKTGYRDVDGRGECEHPGSWNL